MLWRAVVAGYVLVAAAFVVVGVVNAMAQLRHLRREAAAAPELRSRIAHGAPAWRREDEEFPGARW